MFTVLSLDLKRLLRSYYWLLFAIFTLAIRAIFNAFPAWTEQLYSRGLFQVIRYMVDLLTGWLPFPLTYLLFGWLFWKLLQGTTYLIFHKDVSLKQRLLNAGKQVIAFIAGVIALFYWVWGFNYSRIPIEEQLAIPRQALTRAALREELDTQTKIVLALRPQIQPDSSLPVSPQMLPAQMENLTRTAVSQQLNALNFPTPGKPRGRQPFWEGFLLRFGAAGIYNLFTGECNIDKGLYFLTKPYCLGHEFCHGYGFGDEGTCNFLAYIALHRADNISLRYSAELGYWREVASTYRQLEPAVYAQFREGLPAGFRADLDQINQQLERYPEYFTTFRRAAYDNFLKAQGIPEGMENYGKVIPLVIAFRARMPESTQ